MFSLYIENLREFLSNTFNISLFPEEIYFLSTMPSEINPTSIINYFDMFYFYNNYSFYFSCN